MRTDEAETAQERTCQSEQFWKELLGAGAVTPSLVAEYLEILKKRPWKRLGAVLVGEGYLTMKQVGVLLGLQADEPHLRIGELAVREGYCEPRDVERALAIQRISSPGPIDMMFADDRIEEDLMLYGLLGYIHFLEGRVTDLSSLSASVAAG